MANGGPRVHTACDPVTNRAPGAHLPAAPYSETRALAVAADLATLVAEYVGRGRDIETQIAELAWECDIEHYLALSRRTSGEDKARVTAAAPSGHIQAGAKMCVNAAASWGNIQAGAK